MANIAHNFFKLLLILLLSTSLQSHAEEAGSGKGSAVDSFKLLKKARSGVFFYDATVDFSKYDKVIMLPVTRDQAKITAGANPDNLKGWENFDDEDWKDIAGFFDEFARKEFSESDVFKLVEQPGEGVISIEYRLMEFKPNTENSSDDLGTIGDSHNLKGLGNIKMQGVLVDSLSKQLLAVIEGLNSINAGHYVEKDSRVTRNKAWRKSFQKVIDNLHKDLEKVRKQKPEKVAPE